MDNTFTNEVGKKFHEDGRVRYYPGNTFLCHVPQHSTQHHLLCNLQKEVQDLPFSSKLFFLPPSSFHMTVIEGLCDERRQPELWSSLCKPDCSITDAARVFLNAIAALPACEPIRMRWGAYDSGVYAPSDEHAQKYSIKLVPADTESEQRLQQFRSTVSHVLGLHFQDHDTYKFHASVSYTLQTLNEEERKQWSIMAKKANETYQHVFGTLTLGAVEFCVFHDMCAFYPIAYIPLK